MISLSSEITDSKGRCARRGWLFFDRDCEFCTRLARRARPVLEARGYGLAPLQDPRVPELLAVPPSQLLLEMRVLTSDGKQFGGAAAIVYLASRIWWAWPLYALAKLPGMLRVLWAGYRWIALRRNCAGSARRLRKEKQSR